MGGNSLSAYEFNKYIKTPRDEVPINILEKFNPEDFERDNERNKILQRLTSLTGYTIKVDFSLEKSNVAGYVKTTGDRSIYINPDTLDDSVFSEYVMAHEENHLNTMFILPAEDNFSEDHNNIIEALTGHPFLNDDKDFFLEGFNDLKTKKEKSGNENSGYKENIKAVETLNMWSLKILGDDKLMKSFKAGDPVGFAHNLQIFTNRLLLYKNITDISDEKINESGLNSQETQNILNQKILSYEDSVDNKLDAEEIINTWIAEIKLENEVQEIMQGFGKAANDNTQNNLIAA